MGAAKNSTRSLTKRLDHAVRLARLQEHNRRGIVMRFAQFLKNLKTGKRIVLEFIANQCDGGEAKNGREAINKVMKLNPDLVILDISMPELNGLEAAREMRRIAAPIKIIILTVHGGPNIESVVHEAGADAIATKSMAGPSLIPLIESLFEPKPAVDMAMPSVTNSEITIDEVNASGQQDEARAH
jgi:DNA-binding NarL/FixJ family response regulator